MNSSLSGDDSSSSSSDEDIQPILPGVAGNKRAPPAGLSHPVSSGNGDDTSGAQHSIIGPRSNDVLLGRGRPYQNFSGNKRMLEIVSLYKDDYSARPRDQKRAFVETVLDAVIKDGTKFLRRVEESDGSSRWEEVDRTAAAEKVWHALRCKDRPGRRRGKRKAGDEADDEVGLSPHAAEAMPPHPQAQGESMQMPNTSNMSNAHAVLRDIQLHLGNAITASNLLSSMIGTPRPAQYTGMGNAVAAPPSASTLAQAYAQTYGNVPSQPSVGTVVDLLGHDWLRSQGAPPLVPPPVQLGGQQSFPLSYTGVAGLTAPPLAIPTIQAGLTAPPLDMPSLLGMVDPSRAYLASAEQQYSLQNSQPPQSTDRNQILAHAVGILMHAAQQGTLPPP
jgi:hypothetical protein